MFRTRIFLGREMTADCPLLARGRRGTGHFWGHVFGFLLQLADLRQLPLGRRGISPWRGTNAPAGNGRRAERGSSFLRTRRSRGEGFRIFFLIGKNGADVT